MKIAYFIDHLRADGSPFVLTQLVEGFAKLGYQQFVFCLNDSYDEVNIQKIKDSGGQITIIGKLALLSGFGLFRLWYILRKEKVEVAVTLLFVSDVIGRLVSKFAQIPRIVSSIQTHDVSYTKMQRWLVRCTIPLADAVILNSAHIVEFAVQQEGVDPGKIQIIHNGIHFEDYQENLDRFAIRQELGLSSDEFAVGSLGRLVDQKGYDILIRSLAFIPRDNVHLFIAGVGEKKNTLLELANKLGLTTRVHLIGYRRDVSNILKAVDLYVQPSRFEGMPISTLEAMAAGCPIVASAVDGIRELIQDDIHGWLVPTEEPSSLAQAIIEAIEHPEERFRRGEAARVRAREHFNINNMIAAWGEVLHGA